MHPKSKYQLKKKSIHIKKETHKRLKEYTQANNLKLNRFVDSLINAFLDGKLTSKIF